MCVLFQNRNDYRSIRMYRVFKKNDDFILKEKDFQINEF